MKILSKSLFFLLFAIASSAEPKVDKGDAVVNDIICSDVDLASKIKQIERKIDQKNWPKQSSYKLLISFPGCGILLPLYAPSKEIKDNERIPGLSYTELNKYVSRNISGDEVDSVRPEAAVTSIININIRFEHHIKDFVYGFSASANGILNFAFLTLMHDTNARYANAVIAIEGSNGTLTHEKLNSLFSSASLPMSPLVLTFDAIVGGIVSKSRKKDGWDLGINGVVGVFGKITNLHYGVGPKLAVEFAWHCKTSAMVLELGGVWYLKKGKYSVSATPIVRFSWLKNFLN